MNGELPALPESIHIDWDVEIPMDDGAVLRADVYRPKGDGPYPVLMNLGPYAKGFAFQEYAPIQWQQLTTEHPDVLAGTTNIFAQWESVDPEKWCRTAMPSYASMRAVPGRSAGMMDPWSARERRDYHSSIEWAAAAGRGVREKSAYPACSYHAANQWMVATQKPPHLAAICIWEGMSDFYRDGARHGGILCDFWKYWINKQAAKNAARFRLARRAQSRHRRERHRRRRSRRCDYGAEPLVVRRLAA